MGGIDFGNNLELLRCVKCVFTKSSGTPNNEFPTAFSKFT